MNSINWLPQAKKDFLEIYGYIFQENANAADVFENQVYLKIRENKS